MIATGFIDAGLADCLFPQESVDVLMGVPRVLLHCIVHLIESDCIACRIDFFLIIKGYVNNIAFCECDLMCGSSRFTVIITEHICGHFGCYLTIYDRVIGS